MLDLISITLMAATQYFRTWRSPFGLSANPDFKLSERSFCLGGGRVSGWSKAENLPLALAPFTREGTSQQNWSRVSGLSVNVVDPKVVQ